MGSIHSAPALCCNHSLPALPWGSGQPRDEVASLNQIIPWSLSCTENSDSSTKTGTLLQIILGLIRSLRECRSFPWFNMTPASSPHHANYFLQLLFIIYLGIYFPSMGPDFLFVFLVNLFFSTDSQQKCQGLAVVLLFWGYMKQSVTFRGRLLFSSPGSAFTSSVT